MIKSIINDCHKPVTAFIGNKQVWQFFSPADLFANEEQGVWFDPSDLSTMFQDSRGITPVTKDGDPVGLMLDKSQGLEGTVTNIEKPFIADRSDDNVVVTNTSDGTKIVYHNLHSVTRLAIFELGKSYKLSVVYSIPETSGDIDVYNTGGGVDNFLFTATKGVRNKAEVTLTARSVDIYFRAYSGEITLHEIVLKEIEGNHASQPLAASRPIYRTDGVLHWLEFDGVDDVLPISVTLGNNSLLSASISLTRVHNSFVFGGSNKSAKIGLFTDEVFFRLVLNGDIVRLPNLTASKHIITGFRDNGYTTGRIDGVESRATTPDATAHTTWTAFGSANYPAQYLSGSIYGAILLDDYSADKLLKIENYLSAKSGVTL